MNYVDLLFLVLSVITVFVSYKRGFLYALIEMIGIVIGFPLSAFVSKTFSQPIYDGVVKERVCARVSDKIAGLGSVNAFFEDLQSKPVVSRLIGENTDFSAFTASGADAVDMIEANIIRPVATAIIECLLFILTIILFYVVIALIKKVSKPKKRNKERISTKTNKILGAIFGVVKAMSTVLILSTLAFYVLELLQGSDNQVAKVLSGSFVINFVNQHNPLLS